MAKLIYVNDDEVNKIIEEIRAEITGCKCYGSVEIKKTFSQDNRKAIVYFSADAWNKVRGLVAEFSTEVQWHGCVNRISENEFLVYDILVPPHVVTGSTVTSDQEQYNTWLNNLDDETFNHLRFHGHSHVNMGCTPSGVDMTYRNDVVTQLTPPKDENDEDVFFIFMIFNKKGEWTGEIYDLTNNALYSTKDIVMDVYCGEGLLSDFISEAKKQAIREEPKPVQVAAKVTTTTIKGKTTTPSWEYPTTNKKKTSNKTEAYNYGYDFSSGYSTGRAADDYDAWGPYSVGRY